jgi:predicted  nucleic acid-binding Zn-ribbon protein
MSLESVSIVAVFSLTAVATWVAVYRTVIKYPRHIVYTGSELDELRKQINDLLDTVEDIQKGKAERDREIADLRITLAWLKQRNNELEQENIALRKEIEDLRQMYMKSKRGF